MLPGAIEETASVKKVLEQMFARRTIASQHATGPCEAHFNHQSAVFESRGNRKQKLVKGLLW